MDIHRMPNRPAINAFGEPRFVLVLPFSPHRCPAFDLPEHSQGGTVRECVRASP